MKVFVWTNPGVGPSSSERLRTMVETLAGHGVGVLSAFEPATASDDTTPLLERVDAVVIEGTHPTPETGHLVALSLAYKKPILYLAERGHRIDAALQRLGQSKPAGELLRLVTYAPIQLAASVIEFIRRIERGAGATAPTIKFTLRITPAIERYLTYKTKGSATTKADFLRELIERLIADDADYRRPG